MTPTAQLGMYGLLDDDRVPTDNDDYQDGLSYLARHGGPVHVLDEDDTDSPDTLEPSDGIPEGFLPGDVGYPAELRTYLFGVGTFS